MILSEYLVYHHKRLGKGAFGEVCLGLSKKTGNFVAIKKESHKTTSTNNMLQHEYKISKRLAIPAVSALNFYRDVDFNYMVMPLNGPSLEVLHNICGLKFKPETCCQLAGQMIDIIENYHSKGILHRDIKPANFLVDYTLPHKNIHLVDFGLAKKYLDINGNHIPYKDKVPRVGSLRYMSKYTHQSIEASRRDDLYSIGYLLVYLAQGKLPWKSPSKNMTMSMKHQYILNKKLNTLNTELMDKLYQETFRITIENYFKYIDSLSFDQKPDYGLLKSFFKSQSHQSQGQSQEGWDWSIFFNFKKNIM